ncbi:Hypothetical predicted protein [Cloeon dipterum]|uniref:E3 ubiquitin-protein ligase parkin n=2 Tax=Cloeon dipterum TaxID=197152 RepID=A0A8S1CDK6_9INSE|nr:Hypothetical predicted protein [Cloeon dipterum]
MSFIFAFFRSILDRILNMFSSGTQSIKNTLNIYIKTNTGKSVNVDLDPKMDIKNVKELVAPKLGMQPQEVKIIFAGKELLDTTIIADCDLGDQSILHAVRSKPIGILSMQSAGSPSEGSMPMCETLVDLQLTLQEREDNKTVNEKNKAHFYVYCGSSCHGMKAGKLRVRCGHCKSGAVTVARDPCCWEDVLTPDRVEGHCESTQCNGQLRFCQFYFRCADHISQGEEDEAVALYLIKNNIKEVPCLACTDVSNTVLVFPCSEGHVTCLDCFRQYCSSRLRERRFHSDKNLGYTLPCPAGCDNSFIEETHHFRLLSEEEYAQYQRFGAEEFVLQAGGVLCPQPGCGMGILVDGGCTKVACVNGCGFVFCKNCLQGYHIGECQDVEIGATALEQPSYSVDPGRAAQARWDEASKVAIKVTTKPCPKCRTPTERDGECYFILKFNSMNIVKLIFVKFFWKKYES